MPHTTVLHTATMGPIGLFAGCFLELAPGFTALTAFTVMSTTAMILITVTLARSPSAVRSASTTSREMRRGMGEAMSATLATKRGVNMPSPDIEVVGTAAGTTRARTELTRNASEGREREKRRRASPPSFRFLREKWGPFASVHSHGQMYPTSPLE
jgi:hypothetical protein